MPLAFPEKFKLLERVAERFCELGELSPEACDSVRRLPGEPVPHPRGADLHDVEAAGPHFIISGWACRMRPLADGRRQVLIFLAPGDLIGSFRGRPGFDFYRTVALTRVETLDATALLASDQGGASDLGGVVRAGIRLEDQMQGLLYDQIVRLGARDAYCGLADLLLEFESRLARMAQVEEDGSFHLPIGQRVLAQALGVSVVHLNQTFKRLVADGMIETRGAHVRLLEPQRMTAMADGRALRPESSLGANLEARIQKRGKTETTPSV